MRHDARDGQCSKSHYHFYSASIATRHARADGISPIPMLESRRADTSYEMPDTELRCLSSRSIQRHDTGHCRPHDDIMIGVAARHRRAMTTRLARGTPSTPTLLKRMRACPDTARFPQRPNSRPEARRDIALNLSQLTLPSSLPRQASDAPARLVAGLRPMAFADGH